MNKDIGHFESALYEIRAALANNENIRKLLFYSSPDALNREAPSIDTVLKDNNLISLYPILDEGIITSDRDAAIALDLSGLDTDFSDDDTSIYGTLVVTVLCTDKNLLLNDQKMRTLELTREVVNTLDGLKVSLSGKIEVLSEDRFINRHYYGYSIKILLTDDATGMEF